MDNPILIFVVSLVFHVFADTLLHWNIYPSNFKRYPVFLVALDIVSGLVVAYFLTGNMFFTWSVWAAIAGGNVADVLHGLWELTPRHRQDKLFPLMRPLFIWHDKLQFETSHVFQGLIWQIALVGLSVFLFIR